MLKNNILQISLITIGIDLFLYIRPISFYQLINSNLIYKNLPKNYL